MAIGSTRIQGGDLYATNASGNNWVSQLQATTGRRSILHKLIVTNLSASQNVYVWIFDNTSQSNTNPRVAMFCPAGVVTTLDLTTGTPFVNGIWLWIGTNLPVNTTTAIVDAGSNAAILDVTYRLE